MPTRHRRSKEYARVDRYVLYEAAVQDVDFDLSFFQRTYRQLRKKPFRLLREDFCGTARLAYEWVRRKPNRRAWGVDLSAGTLAWARRHHLRHLGEAADRVKLIRADVRRSRAPLVDVIAALNCSYWVFHTREELRGYFERARRGLRPGGLLILDSFGGEGCMRALEESRRVRGRRTYAGERVVPFTYTWEQKSYNPVDHHLVAYIHFNPEGHRAMRRAFKYDWRMWTLPEVTELLREAGFRDAHVYVQGWDDDKNQPISIFRRRGRFENQEAWLACIVGVK
jgi:SAM-dependent methyltransferase